MRKGMERNDAPNIACSGQDCKPDMRRNITRSDQKKEKTSYFTYLQLTFRKNDVSLYVKFKKWIFPHCSAPSPFGGFYNMKRSASLAALLTGVFCLVFVLCSCGKVRQNKKAVDQDTLRLMQKTQAELTACVERCRSAAAESKDKEILLALANSQEILADRHETIIRILLKKYKLERISTTSYSIEMDPRTLVHAPLNEYRDFLAKANPQMVLPEILIALEITNKVLESDLAIQSLIDFDSEDPFEGRFFLCPVCGQLELDAPADGCCPVCGSDKITELKDGELPPPDKESFLSPSI